MGECPYDAYHPDETQKKLAEANRRIEILESLVRRYQCLPASGWHSFDYERREVNADAEKLLGNPHAGKGVL